MPGGIMAIRLLEYVVRGERADYVGRSPQWGSFLVGFLKCCALAPKRCWIGLWPVKPEEVCTSVGVGHNDRVL